MKRQLPNQSLHCSKPNPKTSSNSKLLVITFVIACLFFVNAVSATTYYTGASGTPETLTNWWTGTNGTGAHPVNFTTAGDIFVIQNTHTMATAANWTVAGTVQVNSGGIFTSNSSSTSISLGALTINSGGIVNMLRPLTVTGATSITGKINFGSSSSTIRAMAFNGAVTLNSGAVWDETNGGANTVLDTYSFGNSFTNNATTFTNLTGGQHTFTGTTMTLSGSTTTTMDLVAISGTYTNSGTLTVGTTLSGTGALTNTGTLNIAGTSTITTLTATAVGNLVNYTGATQTVKATTYYNLTLSGSGAKTTTGVTVNGIFNIAGTATASAVPTYGANATLEYSGSAAQTSGIEFPATFSGTGGVIINNSFGVSLGSAKTISYSLTMTLGTLNMANTNLTVGSLTGSGNITNSSGIAAAVTLTIGSDNTSPATYSGIISTGTATSVAVTKNGTGTLTLSGANTYAGGTILNTGILQISNSAALGAVGASVTVNGGTLDLDIDASVNAYNITVGGSATIESDRATSGAGVIHSLGTLSIGAFTLTISGGNSVTSGTAGITFGAVTHTGAPTYTVSNPSGGGITQLSIGAVANSTFLTTFNGNGNIIQTGVFGNGSGGITFSGTGTLTLNQANTYTGLTTISSGTVKIGNATALGSTTSGTSVSSGAVLDLNGTNYTNTEALTINGTGISSGGVLINSSASAANYAGAITLGSASSISTTGNITLGSNGITGAQDLTKIGTGILNLGSGTVTLGSLTISAGTLTSTTGTMNIAGNYSNNSIFTHNSGTVIFNGTTQSIAGSVSSTFNNLTTNNSGTKTLGINTTVSGTLSLTTPTILAISSYTLTINGTVSGTGTLSGSSNSNLTIGGSGALGTLYFDQTTDSITNIIYDIVVNRTSSGTLSLGNKLVVLDSYTPTAGILTTAGNLVLRSTSVNTARVTAGSSSGGYISGNVTVERYIPASGRRYRLLTPTVTTATTINANWQEAQTNIALSPGGNINTHPGWGTQITGTGGSANGFDVTQTNAASLYLCSNGVTQTYSAVTNTNSNILNPYTGYFLFIRGDRSMNMSLYNTNVSPGWIPLPSSSTTLRAKGSLVEGDITGSVFTNTLIGGNGAMNLITNPYPSPIDWTLVQPDCSYIASSYTLWDADYSHRGGFVTVSSSGASSSGAANQFIQPGQAFFVQATGASIPIINIKESHKAAGNNNGIFTQQAPLQTFNASLYFTDGTGVRTLTDGVTTVYDTSYSAGIDLNDAIKTTNWDENIAISRQGYHLAIEARPKITSRDTMPLFMNHMNQMVYEWQFTPSNFNQSLRATLIDNYTGLRTSLSVSGTTVVPFTITSVAASSDTGRFKIVFGSLWTLASNPITVNAYQKNQGIQVDWVAATETNMDHYEVEKSVDGSQFSLLGTLTATGNSSSPLNYNWFDANPFSGNNFYRIKSVDKTGAIKFSNIVKVNIGKGNPAISVYPNPVTGNSFGLQLSNLPKGNYEISLTNNLGQQIYSTQLLHNGGSALQNIELKNILPRGVYQLLFTGDGVKMTTGLIKK